jgi:hypothetical protein
MLAGIQLILKTQDPKSKTQLSLRVLDAMPRTTIHQSRNWTKADVYLVEWPPESGTQVVVKDMRCCPLWFRMATGRAFMRREWKALRALDGTRGVPRPIARPHTDVLVMERMLGTPLCDIRSRDFTNEALARIEEIVAELHARGVTHGDLHDNNILIAGVPSKSSQAVEAEGENDVTLIDWATALVWGRKRNAAKERLFREFEILDRRSVAKVKLAYARDKLSDDEFELLDKGGTTLYRGVKSVRRALEKARGRKPTGKFEKRLTKARLELEARKTAEAE